MAKPASSSESLHEPLERLSDETIDLHRAIVSLIEELDAVDWYTQRAEACSNDELRQVLLHNRDEEIEHAMMNLEWIRRHHPAFAEVAHRYLFTKEPITAIEAEAENTRSPATSRQSSLGIGGLKAGTGGA